jgi:hypothetical protein
MRYDNRVAADGLDLLVAMQKMFIAAKNTTVQRL